MPFSPVPELSPLRAPPSRQVRGAVATVGSIVVVTAVKLAAFDYIGPATPFLLYFASIIVGAWFGGWRGGLAVTAVCATLGLYLFLPPFRSLAIPDLVTAVRTGVFVVEGVAITAITARLRAQEARTEAAAVASKGALA